MTFCAAVKFLNICLSQTHSRRCSEVFFFYAINYIWFPSFLVMNSKSRFFTNYYNYFLRLIVFKNPQFYLEAFACVGWLCKMLRKFSAAVHKLSICLSLKGFVLLEGLFGFSFSRDSCLWVLDVQELFQRKLKLVVSNPQADLLRHHMWMFAFNFLPSSLFPQFSSPLKRPNRTFNCRTTMEKQIVLRLLFVLITWACADFRIQLICGI